MLEEWESVHLNREWKTPASAREPRRLNWFLVFGIAASLIFWAAVVGALLRPARAGSAVLSIERVVPQGGATVTYLPAGGHPESRSVEPGVYRIVVERIR